MLIADRMGRWRGRYRLVADGQPVAEWDPSWWRTGGDFEVDGHRYQVRANGWGSKYRMVDEHGAEVGSMRRTSAWSGAVEADLPGMPLPVQICVLGVQIARWQAEQSAA
jgi:hypothetical protein